VMMVTLILTLVTKFGPTALEEFQNWRQGCADPQAARRLVQNELYSTPLKRLKNSTTWG